MDVMSYLVESTICSAIFAAYYLCFLRNGLFYGWNRFYLLLSATVSLVIPLVHIPVYVLTPELPLIAYEGEIVEIPMSNPVQETSNVDVASILFAVYGLSLLGLIVFELRSLWKINLLKKGVSPLKINNVKVYKVDSRLAPFSLFNTIFWRKEIDINSPDGQRILQHELLHVKAYHSYDKLFMQLLCTVFWMNPVFWLLKRELSMVHEYAADNACIENDDTQRLSALILCSLYPNHFLEFTNNFFQSNIKRRIVMLSRKCKKQKLPLFRRLMVIIPVTLALAVFTVRIEAKPTPVKDVASYKDAIVEPVFGNEPGYLASGKDNEVFDDDPIPYSDVTEKPMFQGEEAASFIKWIYPQLVYPKEAIEKNIEGIVRIAFVINEDGSLSDIKSVKKVDTALVSAVMEIIKKSPKWIPGKHKNKFVKVTYQVPVMFKLDKNENTKEKPDSAKTGMYFKTDFVKMAATKENMDSMRIKMAATKEKMAAERTKMAVTKEKMAAERIKMAATKEKMDSMRIKMDTVRIKIDATMKEKMDSLKVRYIVTDKTDSTKPRMYIKKNPPKVVSLSPGGIIRTKTTDNSVSNRYIIPKNGHITVDGEKLTAQQARERGLDVEEQDVEEQDIFADNPKTANKNKTNDAVTKSETGINGIPNDPANNVVFFVIPKDGYITVNNEKLTAKQAREKGLNVEEF